MKRLSVSYGEPAYYRLRFLGRGAASGKSLPRQGFRPESVAWKFHRASHMVR
jgi:hypothetical protein